jgi:hypothetical protein
MKITIISFDNWGLNEHLKNALVQMGHTVQHINFFDFKYKYPNFKTRLYNFILKTVTGRNIKNIYYGNEIIKKLEENGETQDIILTLKGDFIDPESILKFKKHSKKSIAFFNDSISRYPKIKSVITHFDEVYSFEKGDCKKNNLKFITNWIYPIQICNGGKEQFQVFNISSKDRRSAILSKIARILKENKINYKIIIFDKKNKNHDPNLEYTSKQIPLTEVNENLHNAQVLLDIHRKGQIGLTFRVFESLALEKKLITTNADIKNYDFYDPQNILIIDEKNPDIPFDFFNKKYNKISKEILNKYSIETWVTQIIN